MKLSQEVHKNQLKGGVNPIDLMETNGIKIALKLQLVPAHIIFHILFLLDKIEIEIKWVYSKASLLKLFSKKSKKIFKKV